jgi:hypothetical protein
MWPCGHQWSRPSPQAYVPSMAARAWVEEKWMEVLCIGTTLVLSTAGTMLVAAATRYSADHYYRYLGSGLPAPTQFLIDLFYAPSLIGALPALMTIAMALAGAWLRAQKRNKLGTVLLVIAPQLALLEVLIAFSALALPIISILPPLLHP